MFLCATCADRTIFIATDIALKKLPYTITILGEYQVTSLSNQTIQKRIPCKKCNDIIKVKC